VPTALEIYISTVRDLPPAEHLRLAALILGQLARSAAIPPDSSDTWSDEDLRDLTAFSIIEHATVLYPDEQELF
jgi:hypothetical protein